MTISQLVEQLDKIKAEHGDLEVSVQSLSHRWSPEPELRPFNHKELGPSCKPYVLLNP